MEEKKSKFKALSLTSNVKVKLSDHQFFKWATGTGSRADYAIHKEKVISEMVDKDGYVNGPLWKFVNVLGNNMPDEILINEDDLHEQQVKQPEPEREI